MYTCWIGFIWQGFGSGGNTEVASVKRCQKFPPCQTESVPAASKMDPLTAKAEPTGDAGSTSEITYLRRGGNNCEK